MISRATSSTPLKYLSSNIFSLVRPSRIML
jgi:hypothetical protein